MREDWIECTLGEILTIERGGSPRPIKEFLTNDDNGVNWIKIGDATNSGKYILETVQKIKPSGITKSREVFPGDLLLSNSMSFGRPYIMGIKGAIHDGWLVIRDNKYLDKDFLYYALGSPTTYNQFSKKAKGSTVKNLNIGLVSNVNIKLVSLPIQKAIVKKIEELFSSLDSGIADLKKAQDQLVIYRQAVLKKAFEGELTKEWRAKQTDLPSADELLEQIKEERQKHYEQQLADWKEAVKVWEKNQELSKKPKKPKKLIDYPEIEQSSTLPILNLGELVFQISNKMMPEEAPEFPFIGMDCLDKNSLKPHFTYKFKEFKSAGNWFNKNHVLYGRLRPYLNKVYQAEYEGVASGEFIILETINSFNPNYLKLILHQQDFVHWSNNQSAGDKPRVKFDQIALYPIKVPTIKEQLQIVSEIESRLSVCDKVEKDIADSLEKAQALRQSILKKAFEGTLLSEEELAACKAHKDYEPASVLLERIKAEKKK